MNRLGIVIGGAAAATVLAIGPASAADIWRVVDMVPNSRSAETNQDAEPTITVDPRRSNSLAGSAFTWDNLTQSPMVTATAPIYVSQDRGDTWTLAFIVPSKVGAPFPTGDITLSFSAGHRVVPASGAERLYGGTLSTATWPAVPMTVLRTSNVFASTVMATLDTRSGNVDQPHTIAKSAANGQDKLYVGFNNGWGCVAPSGRSSTIDASQDASAPTPVLTLDPIDSRNASCQDGFAQVPAVHGDGTVYAAFIHDWSGSPRLVVVRDDNFASGASPFNALTDPSDGKAGRFVTTTLTLAAGVMGQNRLGASNVSIAVDPRRSDRVYVAWGDSGGPNSETIHVRRSINRGVDWSADLLTVTNAMNPEIAINAHGVVAVLYQSVVSGRWETHVVRSRNRDATTFDTPGVILASQDATTPGATFWPYIGDYASLVSHGSRFFGMFSASNYPDKASFPHGVRYQREVDWQSHKLFADAAHTQAVAPSIDPFFFEIARVSTICEHDPLICHALVFDPWWWLKCPQCLIEILIQPGDDFRDVRLIDAAGRLISRSRKLEHAVTIDDVEYTQRIVFRAKEAGDYDLTATRAKGHEPPEEFSPSYVVRRVGGAK